MSNSRLDFAVRRRKGQDLLLKYKKMFLDAGFHEPELEHVDLQSSDEIRNTIKDKFSLSEREVELLSGNSNLTASKLLESIRNDSDAAQCYIFSDDVTYCGMYSVEKEQAIKYGLTIAKEGYSQTCFVVDHEFKYSFTINYYDQNHSDDPNMFDIQRKIKI